MKYIYIISIVLLFFKSWYYGLYELKENKNKPAGYSIFFLSILRAYISFNYIKLKFLDVIFIIISKKTRKFILNFLLKINSICTTSTFEISETIEIFNICILI